MCQRSQGATGSPPPFANTALKAGSGLVPEAAAALTTPLRSTQPHGQGPEGLACPSSVRCPICVMTTQRRGASHVLVWGSTIPYWNCRGADLLPFAPENVA